MSLELNQLSLLMTRQKRMFLNVSSEALQDAGVKCLKEEHNDIGVFVGTAPNTYSA